MSIHRQAIVDRLLELLDPELREGPMDAMKRSALKFMLRTSGYEVMTELRTAYGSGAVEDVLRELGIED